MIEAQHIAFPVRAIGSTDAADKAKHKARAEGYRIRTLVSIKTAKAGLVSSSEPADWVVTLAVVSKS